MELVPIKQSLEENEEFTGNPLYRETVQATVNFYKMVGYVPPWIGYYVKHNGNIVGSAGFKGAPINNTVEIAYGTLEEHRRQGIGTAICKEMVELSLKTNPSVKITARTLTEKSFSAKILTKNNFICTGTVDDPEDGEVWEWLFKR